MLRSILLFILFCTCGPATSSLSAQLRLTVDGGIALGVSNAVVFNKTPRISAFRLGLEYAIWE